jgi:hypothetical protein
LPFDGPVPVAEDNSAPRIIAHTGKITRNVQHIALKPLSLQALVRERIALFRAVGSAQNKADHFTKAPSGLPRRLSISYGSSIYHSSSCCHSVSTQTCSIGLRCSSHPCYRRGDVKSTTSTCPISSTSSSCPSCVAPLTPRYGHPYL